MDAKDKEYKEIFLAEALDNFEEINKVLTQLEKSPKDTGLINTLFRITHTLKGNANGMGYQAIGDLAHVMEDLFGEVRNRNFALNSEMFNALFKAVDVLGGLIQSLNDGKNVPYRGIKTKIEVLIKKYKPDAEVAVQPETKTGTKVKKKSTKPQASKKVSETEAHLVTDTTPDPGTAVDEIVDTEISNKVAFSDLVQVPVRKLDNLLNLVGELLIERDRLIASHEGGNKNEFTRLNRISSDLQYSVMDVRLVQVGFLFNKFHRVVRDAAAIENKNVRLELKGIDTEIDRNILQIISDSLIHIIRNCVSHGIEKVEYRKKLKKEEEGVIVLSARNDSDGVIIEIKDDGKGIDIERVKQKAIERGLVTKEMLALMGKEELLMLIFEPGFSTNEKISELSGRGVGMDVVKRAVDSIGGNINIDTTANEGTTISLKLPSSMAVKGTLLFMLQQQTYAIPLSYTEAVVQLYKSELHKVSQGLVGTYLGKTISVVFLKDLFNLKQGENIRSQQILQKSFDELHPEEQLNVVIVTYNGRTIGLVVDKLLQQKEIVEKPLVKPLDQIKLLSGVTILGNGHVCPVLNIAAIVNHLFSVSLANHKIK